MRMSLIAFVILLVDQVTKQLVLQVLALPVWLISDAVGLRLSYNTGISFSLPVTGTLAILLPFSLVIALLYYFWKYTNESGWTDLVFGLILGGAIGNILDRLLHGAVIDYISIYFYPTFNLADVAITVGFLLFIIRFDTITSKRFSLF